MLSQLGSNHPSQVVDKWTRTSLGIAGSSYQASGSLDPWIPGPLFPKPTITVGFPTVGFFEKFSLDFWAAPVAFWLNLIILLAGPDDSASAIFSVVLILG